MVKYVSAKAFRSPRTISAARVKAATTYHAPSVPTPTTTKKTTGIPIKTIRKEVSAKTGAITYFDPTGKVISMAAKPETEQEKTIRLRQEIFKKRETVSAPPPTELSEETKKSLVQSFIPPSTALSRAYLGLYTPSDEEKIKARAEYEMHTSRLDKTPENILEYQRMSGLAVESENIQREIEATEKINRIEKNKIDTRIKDYETKIKNWEATPDKEKTLSKYNALVNEGKAIETKVNQFNLSTRRRGEQISNKINVLTEKEKTIKGYGTPIAKPQFQLVGEKDVPKVQDISAVATTTIVTPKGKVLTGMPVPKAKLPETPQEWIKSVVSIPRESVGLTGEGLGQLAGQVFYEVAPEEFLGYKKAPRHIAIQRAGSWGRAGGEFGYSMLQHLTGFGAMIYAGEMIDRPKQAALTLGMGFGIGAAIGGVAPILAAKAKLASPRLARGILDLTFAKGGQAVSLGVGGLYVGSIGGELLSLQDRPAEFKTSLREHSLEHAGYMIGAKYGVETVGGLLKPHLGALEEEIGLQALTPKSQKVAKGFRDLSRQIAQEGKFKTGKDVLGIGQTKGTKLVKGETLTKVSRITEKGIAGTAKPILGGTGAEIGQIKGKVKPDFAKDLDFYSNQFKVYGKELHAALGGKPMAPVVKPKVSVKEKVLTAIGWTKPKAVKPVKLKKGELRLEETDIASKLWSKEGKLIEIHGRQMLYENIGRVRSPIETTAMQIRPTAQGGLTVKLGIQAQMKGRASIIDPTRSTKDFPHLLELAKATGIKPAPSLVKVAGKPLELQPTISTYVDRFAKSLGKELISTKFKAPIGQKGFIMPAAPKTTTSVQAVRGTEVAAKGWKIGTKIKDIGGVTSTITGFKKVGRVTEVSFAVSEPFGIKTPSIPKAPAVPKSTPSGYFYYKTPKAPITSYPFYKKSLPAKPLEYKPTKLGLDYKATVDYKTPKLDLDYYKFKAYTPTMPYKPIKPYKPYAKAVSYFGYKPYETYKPYTGYKPYKPYDYKTYKPYTPYKLYKPYGKPYKPYSYKSYAYKPYKPYDYKPYAYKPYKPYDYKPYKYDSYKPYGYKPYDYKIPKPKRIIVPTEEFEYLGLKSPKKLKKMLPAYATFVKTKGEFKQISGALTYKQALVKGIVETDILGAKRTFEVKAIKGKARKKRLPFDPERWLAKRFRKPIKGGIEQVGSPKWIEKTKFAISTIGEKREITFAPRKKTKKRFGGFI